VDEDSMKKLVTCGDSYMSLDSPPGEVTSFLQLYAERKNFLHVSLARAAATCFAIRLQIDSAIERGADFVIVGCTSSNRMDVAAPGVQNYSWVKLNNILYTGYRSLSEYNIKSKNPLIVSDVIENFLNKKHETVLNDHQRLAIKNYVADLHNNNLKRQENYFVISDGLRKLQHYQIPFVYVPHGLGDMDWSWVTKVWPSDRLPCQMPNGVFDFERSVTHNGQAAHDGFLNTLLELTEDWN
jgi:hypothetical protein